MEESLGLFRKAGTRGSGRSPGLLLQSVGRGGGGLHVVEGSPALFRISGWRSNNQELFEDTVGKCADDSWTWSINF